MIHVNIYVDGFPLTKTDSVCGFWFGNRMSGRRMPVALLRQSELCRCGCRGWCSLYALFSYLTWTLLCCAEGRYPLERHDSSPWTELDHVRESLASKALLFTLAIVMIRCDWKEMCETLGFPTWASTEHPCLSCFATKRDWCQYEQIEIDKLPWPEVHMHDYFLACDRCEIEIVIEALIVPLVEQSTMIYHILALG